MMLVRFFFKWKIKFVGMSSDSDVSAEIFVVPGTSEKKPKPRKRNKSKAAKKKEEVCKQFTELFKLVNFTTPFKKKIMQPQFFCIEI